MIKIENLCKYFDGEIVLDHVSLTLPQGKITAIMSESGAGKSTLINLLLGLILPDEGTIQGVPERAGVLFQEDRLLDWLSPLDNLLVCCPQATQEEAIEQLHVLGIGNEKIVAQLSGGMKRRVALAKAILFDGECLILDEPFRGLDDENKIKALHLIQEQDKTTLLVTHDIRDIQYLGLEEQSKIGKFTIYK